MKFFFQKKKKKEKKEEKEMASVRENTAFGFFSLQIILGFSLIQLLQFKVEFRI